MSTKYSKEPNIGTVFGKLTILEESRLENGRRYIKVQCECGNVKSTRIDVILKGITVSCGCHRAAQNRVANLSHGYGGKNRKGLYNSWSCMLQRVNPDGYWTKYYSNRGIGVCERWKSFENFLEDLKPSWFEGATLERVDTNLGYSPENCVWATPLEQSLNTRRSYEFSYEGEKHTISTLAEKLGIPEHKLRYRVRASKDASIEQIVSVIQSGAYRKTCFSGESPLKKYKSETV